MAIFRAPVHVTLFSPALSITEIKTIPADLATLISGKTGTVQITRNLQLEAATITIEEQYENNMSQASMSPINKTKVGLNSSAQISINDDVMSLFATATNAVTASSTPVVTTASITTGSAAITGGAGAFTNVNVGDAVSGTGIPAGTTVSTKTSATALTLSQNATATNASASLTFTPTVPSLLRMSDQAGLTQGLIELPYRTAVFRPYAGNLPTSDISRWIIFPQCSVEGNITASFGLGQQFGYTLTLTAFDPNETGNKVLRGNTALLP